MHEVAIYFEIFGAAVDEDFNPTYAGMKLSLGQIEEKINYEELTKDINIKGMLEMTRLDAIYDEKDIRIITPEEYKEKYEEM